MNFLSSWTRKKDHTQTVAIFLLEDNGNLEKEKKKNEREQRVYNMKFS